MADLTTTYMGLELNNPLIVGSSTLTSTVSKVKELEEIGAGAVVLKSIFEEQIRSDVADVYASLEDDMHPEAFEYLRADMPMRMGAEKYLDQIEETKQAVSIPVIASVNCASAEGWADYARKIQAVGADALEINIYDIPDDVMTSGQDVESRHLALVRSVISTVSIPVAVKIGSFYSSPAGFVKQLDDAGVAAVVMFNRFFQPDIDTDNLTTIGRVNFSRAEDLRLPMRWVAIVREHVRTCLCLSGGVHDAQCAIKALLAGADAFQVCSALYEKGPEFLSMILQGIDSWMAQHGFSSVNDFRGRVSQSQVKTGCQGFERVQYMKTLVGLE